MPSDSDNEEQVVYSIISKSILRLCGGAPPLKIEKEDKHALNEETSVDFMNSEPYNDVSQWRETLLDLTLKSISFSNGKNMAKHTSSRKSKALSNGTPHRNHDGVVDDNFGKGHDIESRIALTIFNRFTSSSRKDKKLKKKRKLNGINKNNVASLDITSDLGLTRTIYSARELSILIANDIEDELWYQRTTSCSSSTKENALCETPNNDGHHCSSNANVILKMVQSNESGMIFIVTAKRFAFLTRNDRYPCSHCTKWCKGQKGLWWHEQLVHGLDHSTASIVAASSSLSLSNRYAIVVYNNGNNENEQYFIEQEKVKSDENKQQDKEKRGDNDPLIDAIKAGNLDEFKFLLQNHCISNFDPTKHIDRNGASLLHWASGSGHLNIVTYLVEILKCSPDQGQKAKRSFQGRTSLHWSARNGHLDVVKYLVETCRVNIDAETIDGTTAFCWASWQGHLEIMKYLYKNGANVNSINSYGCNAVLWSAQSTQSGLGTIQYLQNIGCPIELVNSNGHGILHKSAQRGKRDVCEWVFQWISKNVTESSELSETNIELMISPDAEKCCPSDLAGMENHIELARWLVEQERKLCMKILKLKKFANLPNWLRNALLNAKHLAHRSGLDDLWESGAAVKKMVAFANQCDNYVE